MSAKTFFQLLVTTRPEEYDRMLGQFFLLLPYGWEEREDRGGNSVFEAFSENRDFLAGVEKQLKELFPEAVISLARHDLPDPLESWKEFFTPVHCGKSFVVIPPWLADREFSSPHKIIINPKTAFGTGHHASTCLCLACLDDLFEKGYLKKGDTFIDLGCGSGILGIAASMLGLAGRGIDVDSLAVENARENAQLNNTRLDLIVGDEKTMHGQPANLVLANILAGPLISMAPALAQAAAKNGWIILSGILGSQAEDVQAAYENCGLTCMNRLDSGEWAALVLQKAS